MELIEIMKKRHSVRQYLDKKIESDKREVLDTLVEKINKENNLNIQIIYDEPKCFKSIFAKITKFRNCNNYISIIGKSNDEELDVKAGYFGEEIVLKAQSLGLNTCWVASTHGKTIATFAKDEREVIVIALGYGEGQGVQHKDKDLKEVSNVTENMPEWYKAGLEAALLAPTAINQQKFKFHLENDEVYLEQFKGPMHLVDKGIVKYHFEKISGHEVKMR